MCVFVQFVRWNVIIQSCLFRNRVCVCACVQIDSPLDGYQSESSSSLCLLNSITQEGSSGIKGAACLCARVCCVQCMAAYQTILCVCVDVYACAKAGGRFLVAASWPLRGLLHVKVNGENYKVILLARLVFSPQITPASRGRPTGADGGGLTLALHFTEAANSF